MNAFYFDRSKQCKFSAILPNIGPLVCFHFVFCMLAVFFVLEKKFIVYMYDRHNFFEHFCDTFSMLLSKSKLCSKLLLVSC